MSQAHAALKIATNYGYGVQDPETPDNMSLQELFVEAELYHTLDEGNLRHNHPEWVPVMVTVFTFTDDSRLVRVYDDNAGFSKWTVC